LFERYWGDFDTEGISGSVCVRVMCAWCARGVRVACVCVECVCVCVCVECVCVCVCGVCVRHCIRLRTQSFCEESGDLGNIEASNRDHETRNGFYVEFYPRKHIGSHDLTNAQFCDFSPVLASHNDMQT